MKFKLCLLLELQKQFTKVIEFRWKEHKQKEEDTIFIKEK